MYVSSKWMLQILMSEGKENSSFLCNSVSLCPPVGILHCTKCRSYNQCFIAQATALSMPVWSMQCAVDMWSAVEIKCSLFIYMYLSLWSVNTEEECYALVIFILVNLIQNQNFRNCKHIKKYLRKQKCAALSPL